jgi:CRISPR-associated protein Csm2
MNGKDEKKELEKKIQKEINKIESLKSFAQFEYEEFAPENKVAHLLAKLTEETKMRQLRKVFAEIKNIEKKVKGRSKTEEIEARETIRLLPQLAYASGRDLIHREFYKFLKLVIGTNSETTKLKTVADFQTFVDFMTAVVAYSVMEKK